MNNQDQIKALAELDGAKYYEDKGGIWFRDIGERHDWLTSYDAIIPLIQKQDLEIYRRAVAHLWITNDAKVLMSTPHQLCEALLHATEKWTTEQSICQLK